MSDALVGTIGVAVQGRTVGVVAEERALTQFGRNVQTVLGWQDLTQHDLALEAGKRDNGLSAILRQPRAKLDTLEAVADALTRLVQREKRLPHRWTAASLMQGPDPLPDDGETEDDQPDLRPVLQAVLDRYGLLVTDLRGPYLTATQLSRIFQDATPTDEELARVAEALNAHVRQRELPDRWTADSLRAGKPVHLVTDPAPRPEGPERMTVQVWSYGPCAAEADPEFEPELLGEESVPVEEGADLLDPTAPPPNRHNTRVVIAKGESMAGGGIFDGDRMYVRTDLGGKRGRIVLFEHDGRFGVGRCVVSSTGQPVIQSEPLPGVEIPPVPYREAKIQGRVVRVVRSV